MKFNKFALSELATIKYGKNQKKVLSESGNVPIYGTGGLMGYATTSLYDKPSVLIGRKGTIGKVKYVEHPFWTVDTLFYTIVNTDIVLPKYLYYVMSLIDLNNYNEGTTIPSLRTETLNRLEFDIPSLVEQETILSCLNPIDEKIALNNAINNNLEEQLSALS
jgi:type I restriction enzyme S subunit